MGYRHITEDGKGNVIEEKILYTVDEYKKIIAENIKVAWRQKFPSLEKQINLALGLVPEPESLILKELMKASLDEYEKMKIELVKAKTHEQVHKVLYGRNYNAP